jgi:hypothetical protein
LSTPKKVVLIMKITIALLVLVLVTEVGAPKRNSRQARP